MPRKEGDIKIGRTQTGVRPGQDQITERTITVEFTVRGQGPFSIQEPIEGYSAEEMRRKIDAFADEIIATLEIT